MAEEHSIFVPLFLVLVFASAVVGPILSVILGLLSQRRAQLRRETTLGAVGLAARIWAYQRLVGIVIGAVLLTLFVGMVAAMVAHAPPTAPSPPKRIITSANFEAQKWNPEDSPEVMWRKTTPPGRDWMYDENYRKIFLITKDNLDPRDWPPGVVQEVQQRGLKPPLAGYAYRTDTWELIELPKLMARPTIESTWRSKP